MILTYFPDKNPIFPGSRAYFLGGQLLAVGSQEYPDNIVDADGYDDLLKAGAIAVNDKDDEPLEQPKTRTRKPKAEPLILE